MKQLLDLLKPYFDELPYVAIQSLQLDSRQVKPGDLFIALPGQKVDGKEYIVDAIEKGAVAILQQGEKKSIDQEGQVPVITLPQLDSELGFIAARFFDAPSRHMKVIGVTGTNGKTSVCFLLAQAFEKLGYSTAVIGTLGAGKLSELKSTGFTTPHAIAVQKIFSEFKQQNIEIVLMEVSSHALAQYRVNGICFDTAIFTNLSQDHLDYHGTMDAYAAAKRRLFSWPGLKSAVINENDETAQKWLNEWPAYLNTCVYGVDSQPLSPLFIHADHVKMTMRGVSANITGTFGDGCLASSFLGDFSVSNLLAVLSTLCLAKVPLEKALNLVKGLPGIPGRMQMIRKKEKPLVVIDFAHTPDALEKALIALQKIAKKEIICVFGCGGDRDQLKRPLMGEIVAKYVDQVIITSDNPRHEDPQRIMEDILLGIAGENKVFIEVDRAAAIKKAIAMAAENDIVLIAGKGHETVQIIGDDAHPFSDLDVVEALLGKD